MGEKYVGEVYRDTLKNFILSEFSSTKDYTPHLKGFRVQGYFTPSTFRRILGLCVETSQ